MSHIRTLTYEQLNINKAYYSSVTITVADINLNIRIYDYIMKKGRKKKERRKERIRERKKNEVRRDF